MATTSAPPPVATLSGVPTAGAPIAEFQSQKYPSVYRETVIHKDDRGKYIDPFKVSYTLYFPNQSMTARGNLFL